MPLAIKGGPSGGSGWVREMRPVSHSVFRNDLFRKTETRASVNFAMAISTGSPRATSAPNAAALRRADLYTVLTHPPEAARKEKMPVGVGVTYWPGSAPGRTKLAPGRRR
jgi:hypothetical protein